MFILYLNLCLQNINLFEFSHFGVSDSFWFSLQQKLKLHNYEKFKLNKNHYF